MLDDRGDREYLKEGTRIHSQFVFSQKSSGTIALWGGNVKNWKSHTSTGTTK